MRNSSIPSNEYETDPSYAALVAPPLFWKTLRVHRRLTANKVEDLWAGIAADEFSDAPACFTKIVVVLFRAIEWRAQQHPVNTGHS